MPTDKLQILTPIVTSVNGQTGDITIATSDLENDSNFATKTYVDENYSETIIGLSVDGTTVTYIKGDGSEHTFETQDTNTTYSLGTDTETGLTKLYATTGSAEDGTMTQKAIKTELGKKLSLSGGTMTGALTTKGIKLTSGTDYGTTLPSSPATNQLFFQTIGSNFILDNFYPVGSIYMNVNSTNPGTIFGGTWEQIQGRFLLGMSSNYPAGSQGGEAEHTLTSDELPVHIHEVMEKGNTGYVYPSSRINSATSSTGNYSLNLNNTVNGYVTEQTAGVGRILTGDYIQTRGQAHNNMPPYISVYIWKRTA